MHKVLVVEDSASTRALVRGILEDPSFSQKTGAVEVTLAKNGVEALQLLSRESFDLCVTDINMPGIHGLELIKFIRSSATLAQLPVVIISTQTTQRDIERGLSLGANAFVKKPLDLAELQKTCSDLLSQFGARGAS